MDSIYAGPMERITTEAAVGPTISPRMLQTVGDNLNRQIQEAEARLAGLRAARDSMEKAGLLALKLDDLRMAMQY